MMTKWQRERESKTDMTRRIAVDLEKQSES